MRQWTGVRVIGCGVMILLAATGCGRKIALLLERQAYGPLQEEHRIGQGTAWSLAPVTQVKTQEGIEVTVTHASPQYLVEFFRNPKMFGEYAGMNPFFLEQLVFYVKIVNHSGKKIYLDPANFVLLDDHSNQYASLGGDYATALAEAKAPVATLTRGVLADAHPGYFGIGVPVGQIIGKPQQRFALLKMASLQPGYLHDGVVYDGFVAFWSPNEESKILKLVLADIKSDFIPQGFARSSVDFIFELLANRK